jgi:hypothetical protein
MRRPASLRVIAALLLVLATIVFVIGAMAERSVARNGSEPSPSEAVTASSNEQANEASGEAAEGHVEGEAAEGAGEEAGSTHEDAHADEVAKPHSEANETSETILGINVESTSMVAAAVLISLLSAAALWFLGTPPTLVVAAVVALLFAALDLREVAHQLSEGRGGLVVLALLAAVLHAGAAVACLALTRRTPPTGTPSLAS